MPAQAKLIFKVTSYAYETFLSFMSALQNHIVWSISKTFNLELNVSLVPNKAPNLHSVICSESITVSIKNKTSQPAFACSKLTIETVEQGVKYVQC